MKPEDDVMSSRDEMALDPSSIESHTADVAEDDSDGFESDDEVKGPAGKYMVLDGITVRNLEIVVNNTTGGSEGTLLGRLDSCNTAMGRRVLRHWVVAPLLQVSIKYPYVMLFILFSFPPGFTHQIKTGSSQRTYLLFWDPECEGHFEKTS